MHRFYAPSNAVGPSLITLNVDETRHLRDVLRRRVGDIASVFNGCGREYRCRILSIEKRSSTLEILSEVSPAAPESPLRLVLAASLLKADKFDLVVQKSVELGVDALIPIMTDHCDVRVRDNAARADRWRRIALEATKQCGRATLMSVSEIQPFDELFAAGLPAPVFVFSEREGSTLDLTSAKISALAAVVGPEGGWSDEELKTAADNGARLVTLGGRIMRAETAAIAITAILQHRSGDLN